MSTASISEQTLFKRCGAPQRILALQEHLRGAQQHHASSSWAEQFHEAQGSQAGLRPPLGRGQPGSWAQEFAHHSSPGIHGQPEQAPGAAWAEQYSSSQAPGASWAQEFSEAEVCVFTCFLEYDRGGVLQDVESASLQSVVVQQAMRWTASKVAKVGMFLTGKPIDGLVMPCRSRRSSS